MDRAVHPPPRDGALTAVLDPPVIQSAAAPVGPLAMAPAGAPAEMPAVAPAGAPASQPTGAGRTPTGVRTGPLTFGQLFAWREAELLPPGERDQPNLLLTFALHGKASVSAMRSAFARLRAHHETLRTTFAPDGPGREPLQLVHPPDTANGLREAVVAGNPAITREIIDPPDGAGRRLAQLTEVAVPPGEDPAAFATRLGADLQRRPFDLTAEEPWRACVVVDAGAASHLVIVVHHIALDEWSVNLLIADFDTLLGGGTPDPPASQLALAHAQRHDPWWRANQTSAEHHLRATYTAAASGGSAGLTAVPAADRVGSAGRGTVPAAVGGGATRPATVPAASRGGAESPHIMPAATEQVVLRSSATLPAAAALARRLTMPLPSIVLAACCRALHRHTGAATLLINTMCANRLYPDAATLAGTMSQWAPLVSTHTAGEPPDQFIHRLHRAAVRAGQHGCYNIDLRARVRAEAASAAGPAHELYFFNYVQAGGPGPSFDVPEWQLERQPIRYYAGPPLYLQARQEADYLELTARSRLTAVDPTTLEALVTDVHNLLLDNARNSPTAGRVIRSRGSQSR